MLTVASVSDSRVGIIHLIRIQNFSKNFFEHASEFNLIFLLLSLNTSFPPRLKLIQLDYWQVMEIEYSSLRYRDITHSKWTMEILDSVFDKKTPGRCLLWLLWLFIANFQYIIRFYATNPFYTPWKHQKNFWLNSSI